MTTSVVLTHLVPPPENDDDAAAFADDLRQGGCQGDVTVGTDLTTVVIATAPTPSPRSCVTDTVNTNDTDNEEELT